VPAMQYWGLQSTIENARFQVQKLVWEQDDMTVLSACMKWGCMQGCMAPRPCSMHTMHCNVQAAMAAHASASTGS
jgi:hypothetical protein